MTFKVKNIEVHPDLYYDPSDHLWIRYDGKVLRVGVEPMEQEAKGSLVAVQIESAGKRVKRGDALCSVEAEKHVGVIHAPVSGEVVSVNEKAISNPQLVNTDPYGEGWLVEIAPENFELERASLITGETDLRTWYESEIQKYEERGWLAEQQ